MPQTTLILKNACIYTMDGRVEEAVAISGDKIAKVGSNQEMEAWQGEHTQVIDLGGRTVVPGFNDTHTHLVGYGNSLRYVNLENCRSREEMSGGSNTLLKKSRSRRENGYSAGDGTRTCFQTARFQPKKIWTTYPASI